MEFGKIAIGLGCLGLLGLGYYFFIYRKIDLCAEFIKDGFAYKLDKTQAYSKKEGEWAGCAVIDFDKDYFRALNSSGDFILLKKTDVKVRKEKM